MSLTINRVLTTKDGGTVSGGSYVEFEAIFPAGVFEYNISMKIWRNLDAKNQNFRPLNGVIEIPDLNYSSELTLEDYNSLTPFVMHQRVKNYLENLLGAGTVIINE